MKTNHNTTVTVVAVSKDSSYKVLERVYVNAAMVSENHVPFKFPETGDTVFFLIDESLIFIKKIVEVCQPEFSKEDLKANLMKLLQNFILQLICCTLPFARF